MLCSEGKYAAKLHTMGAEGELLFNADRLSAARRAAWVDRRCARIYSDCCVEYGRMLVFLEMDA